ncbi:flagellar hook-basal body complex protein FliE [Desulforamulus ruminis]|uniref:Flagellar hook-basal body complex protein FliE n=1 Tax=Desulforamulus ruminis (strain ATCC 23193 / DSM 2154 / NCIMB 8452 / DL) TaxID=696281 RepID=F6DNR6_DESRL|nr:flagellar hook-basal body complex protein FliE [Desulforamulus ruminis]AEG59511.1 flagellar hook-basal body complex subunit FliE [Desulforamulus ruminis DSM 2154]
MNILPVPLPLQIPENSTKDQTPAGLGFGEALKSAVANLNESQTQSDEIMQKFMVGEIQDIHQVTIAMLEAKHTVQLAVEVRNKVVEAYQEISRMQL